uniref:Uncharacterized protein n=1 Tax=Gadus morhua TaxID=8049 RepID=A0A8C5ANJ7_GADMO
SFSCTPLPLELELELPPLTVDSCFGCLASASFTKLSSRTFFLTRWEMSEVDFEDEAPSKGLVEIWRDEDNSVKSSSRLCRCTGQYSGAPTHRLPDWQRQTRTMTTTKTGHRSQLRIQRTSRPHPGRHLAKR